MRAAQGACVCVCSPRSWELLFLLNLFYLLCGFRTLLWTGSSGQDLLSPGKTFGTFSPKCYANYFPLEFKGIGHGRDIQITVPRVL